ncbi:type II restriction endonuclease [Candidatus Palauibacter sp.]|uniref:type II restriction endonuclease n=1 Tax=Candidatus Palauibacter sp. TaxID=3101350 RepID=UPI003CC633A3
MKRLAAVEINPSLSNQHEFNAGRLRRELGLTGNPCRGRIDFLFYLGDDQTPVTETERYTLYDSRLNKPRAAEWRMYYTNLGVSEHARANDLMLLFRPDPSSTDLVAVIACRGTAIERALSLDLARREPEDLVGMLFADSQSLNPQTIGVLLQVLRRPEPQVDLREHDFARHPLLLRSAARGAMPTTAEMAAAAQAIVSETGVTPEDPDDFLDSSLDAETGLFTAIELELGNRKLAAIPEEHRLDFDVLRSFFMSFLQSRRARRGQSLENHFRYLLESRRIPHAYQCRTEGGKTPDFIFPSCESYHDPAFPDDHLRMVGCKTKVRERHSQWLDEATRIRLKFALCVDDRLTDALLLRYEDRLRFFLPRRLLDTTYAARESRPLLGSVGDLIAEVASI